MEALQQRIAEFEAALAAKDAERAAKDARLREQESLMAQVAALTRQAAALTEKLGQNSRNSHLPPSSDLPGNAGGASGGKPRSKSKRKRGGQR